MITFSIIQPNKARVLIIALLCRWRQCSHQKCTNPRTPIRSINKDKRINIWVKLHAMTPRTWFNDMPFVQKQTRWENLTMGSFFFSRTINWLITILQFDWQRILRGNKVFLDGFCTNSQKFTFKWCSLFGEVFNSFNNQVRRTIQPINKPIQDELEALFDFQMSVVRNLYDNFFLCLFLWIFSRTVDPTVNCQKKSVNHTSLKSYHDASDLVYQKL